MNYRKLGKTGFEISEISLGTWQIGGKWGSGFSDKTAEKTINTAIDKGINFLSYTYKSRILALVNIDYG